jgi:hypothetical protein
MMTRIARIARDAMALHGGVWPPEDQLSDAGWLQLVGAPWLLRELAEAEAKLAQRFSKQPQPEVSHAA